MLSILTVTLNFKNCSGILIVLMHTSAHFLCSSIKFVLSLFVFQVDSNGSLPTARPLSKEELWRFVIFFLLEGCMKLVIYKYRVEI